jgi:hypothetical protein
MRAFLGLILLSGITAATAAELMYPLPKGAVEIGHVAIQPHVYEEDHFRLNERFPGTSAVQHYSAIFAGWRACRGSDRGWVTFPDASGTAPQFVHQLLRFWVNAKNDEAVTLVLRYESPGLSTRDVPSSDDQFVALTRLRHIDAENQLFGKMGLRCATGK